MSPHGPFVFGGTTNPSTLKLAVDQPPPNGITDVAPAVFTPGTCAIRVDHRAEERRLRGVVL